MDSIKRKINKNLMHYIPDVGLDDSNKAQEYCKALMIEEIFDEY